ncbi:uncharacterized protein LOC127094604 [Lathyrus oleraceus]|uniref:uncharacterized protein LOC127094604 n=1 Tax=Pisum sativum TaxID=3888 RepID=UPI0021D1C4CB|nr:uncharacterized protein LOC127094604 [Pisum sativum]
MLKDCIGFAKGCQEFQVHSGIQHVPTSELNSIVKPWLFKGWALDLIGEIRPASSKSQKYLLVDIDYFTKWIEEISLVKVDQEAIIEFIKRNIIYRLGVPETANGKDKSNSKSIISLIKKHVGKKPKNWHQTLDQVIWACRTSPKEAKTTMPFRLTYGDEVQRQHEIPSDQYWGMMLDEMVDLDEERLPALNMLIRQKERVVKAYNKKVMSKAVSGGDYVWKVILPMDQRDRTLGKWSSNWEGPFRILQVFSNNAYEI